jgi:triosephosphate isomerase
LALHKEGEKVGDIFVNLKRFEVPRELGGVCPQSDPVAWMKDALQRCKELGLGDRKDVRLTFFVPEALIPAAVAAAQGAFAVGCQGVFRENITPGGNFGAFTANLPATAARNLGCSWSIIGHSEERRDKLQVMQSFAPEIVSDSTLGQRAKSAVNQIINAEVLRALESGLNVLVCVGETAEERGGGTLAEQKPRVEAALRTQVVESLRGAEAYIENREMVIGYEPIWAIGPGKTPPDGDYIAYVAELIKEIVQEEFGFTIPVVYGGGLKKENAAMLGGLAAVDGGLVALTRFTGQIGFEPEGLLEIVAEYVKGRGGYQGD